MATGSRTTRRLARIGMAWMILSQGCAPAMPGVEADVAAILDRARAGAPARWSVVADDLGPTLARGQELRHAFRIENATDRPWRIVGAEALTPCCSAVGPLPGSIPPGGAIEVPVLFRPGHQSGRKRVEFVVRTDDPGRPIHHFALVASLISELEVRPHDANPATLPLNAPGLHRYTVVCRRLPATDLTILTPAPLVGEDRGEGDAGPSTSAPSVPTPSPGGLGRGGSLHPHVRGPTGANLPDLLPPSDRPVPRPPDRAPPRQRHPRIHP